MMKFKLLSQKYLAFIILVVLASFALPTLSMEQQAPSAEKQQQLDHELLKATSKNHIDVEAVSTLIQEGANVNYLGSIGSHRLTPLMLAVRNDSLLGVRLLLEHGAEVNWYNKFGSTPLISAAQGGNVDVVQELLVHGADVNRADNDGYTALMWAALSNPEVTELLLRHGAYVGKKDNAGNDALDWAERHHAWNGVRVLLNHGTRLPKLENIPGSKKKLRAKLSRTFSPLVIVMRHGKSYKILHQKIAHRIKVKLRRSITLPLKVTVKLLLYY